MGTVKVTNIEPIADNGTLTIGNSGDTIALTSGAKTSGFGKIGQVVSETSSSSTTVSSNTYTDLSGMTLNITPSSTSSKILVFVQAYFYIAATGVTENYAGIKLVRDSTDVHTPPANNTGPFGHGIYTQSITTDKVIQSLYSFHYLDSPLSTSQITYKLQGRPFNSANGNFIFNRDLSGGTTPTSVITAMEILD